MNSLQNKLKAGATIYHGDLLKGIIQADIFDNVIYVGPETHIDLEPGTFVNIATTFTFIKYEKLAEVVAAAKKANEVKDSGSCSVKESGPKKDFETFERLSKLQTFDNKKSLFVIAIPRWRHSQANEEAVIELIRKYVPNSKVVMMYLGLLEDFTYNGQSPRQYLHKFADTYMLFINFNPFGFDMYMTCLHCEKESKCNGKYINSWSPYFGFKFPLKFPNGLEGNFHGDWIFFQVMLHPANMWIASEAVDLITGTGCIFEYAGPLWEDYLILSRMLNFTLVINEEKVPDGSCPYVLRFRGVTIPFPDSPTIQAIANNEADIAGGGLTAYHDASNIAQISAASYYQTGANIVSIEPLKTKASWNALLLPYAGYSWFLILSTIPVCGSLLWILRKYLKNPDKTAMKSDCIWDVIMILLWGSAKVPNPPTGIWILLSFYMLATFIIINEYMGAVTSFMVKTNYVSPPIETTEQLWQTNLDWLGGRMTDYYLNYFESIKEIKDRLVPLKLREASDEIDEAITTMLDHPEKYVYFEKKDVVEWDICQHSLDLQGRNLYYSHQTIGDYNTYHYLAKNSIYTELFNRKIILLHDMGIIRHNHLRFLTLQKACHRTYEEDAGMVSLDHFKIGLVLLGIGYMVAFYFFLHEIQDKIREYLILLLKDKKHD